MNCHFNNLFYTAGIDWFLKFGDVFGMHNTRCRLVFKSNFKNNEISEICFWYFCQPANSSWWSGHSNGFPLLAWAGSDAGDLVGQNQARQTRRVVSTQILLFVRSQPLYLRGWTSDLSPLLPEFLVPLFERLRFPGISIFLGWLKISSEVKNGGGKGIMFRHSVSWWSTWDHLSWWPVMRKYSIFLQLECFPTLWWSCASLSDFHAR